MDARSLLGSLQLPIAGAGALVLALAVASTLALPPSPPDSEGFVRGLAFIVLYVLAWGGFVLLALGLAIPPGGGVGVDFTRGQRALFLLAALSGAGSVVVPFAAFALLYANPTQFLLLVGALVAVAVLSLLGGLGWRAGQALRARRGTA
ncbi:MAG: hypothetical protein ABEJ74_00680 [Haloferacaceae archaeon]